MLRIRGCLNTIGLPEVYRSFLESDYHSLHNEASKGRDTEKRLVTVANEGEERVAGRINPREMEGYRWLMRCPVCGTYFNTVAGKEPEKVGCERCNYKGEFDEFLEYEVEKGGRDGNQRSSGTISQDFKAGREGGERTSNTGEDR